MSDALPYLKPSKPLEPADAAVALMVDEDDRYVMQLRDAIPTIFFPDHWGCFGGALEPGESYEDGLIRELHEELDIDVSDMPIAVFTDFSFDFGFAGGGIVHRRFFEVRIPSSALASLTLSEGREIGVFPGPELLQKSVVPYDRFALWMHCYRVDLTGQP
ncbi:MAG: NUDIX domain-containing protein [Pseudomonadota bacterium]